MNYHKIINYVFKNGIIEKLKLWKYIYKDIAAGII